jgi:hypothetical protein
MAAGIWTFGQHDNQTNRYNGFDLPIDHSCKQSGSNHRQTENTDRNKLIERLVLQH